MATNTFPALAIQQPQQQDLLGQVGKAMALKTMLQNQAYQQQMQPLELQAEQQRLQTEQQTYQMQKMSMDSQLGMMRAYTEAKGDPDKTMQLAGQYNVLPKDMLAFQQQQVEYKKNLATMDETQLKNLETQGYNTRKLFDPILQADPADQPAMWAQAKQEVLNDPNRALKYGITDPSQIPDYQSPEHVKVWDAALTGHDKMVEDQQKAMQAQKESAEAAKVKAETPGAAAESQIKVAEQQSYATWAQQPKNANKTYADYKAEMAGKTAGAEAWARVGAEKNLEQYKIQLQQSLLPEGLKTVDPRLAGPAAADYTKNTEAYLKTVQNAQNMQDVIDAARKGNVVAYRYIPQESTMEVTTTAGIKRINMAEIKNVARSGSAWDRIKGMVGGEISGKSFDSKVIDAFESTSNDVLNRATQNYENNVATNHQAYGSTIQPFRPELPGHLPPEARASLAKTNTKLEEGKVTTFGNGQQWTLRDGREVRVR